MKNTITFIVFTFLCSSFLGAADFTDYQACCGHKHRSHKHHHHHHHHSSSSSSSSCS